MSSSSKKAVPNYSNVRANMQRYFAINLTDEQIKRYSAGHPVTKRDSRQNACDTMDRDLLIDAICQDLFGEDGMRWPMNMDSEDYHQTFYPAFKKAAIAKGIELAAGWDVVDIND